MLGGISIAGPLLTRKRYGFAELSGSKVVNRQESIITVAPGLRWLRSNGPSVAVAAPIPVSGGGSGGRSGVGITTQFDWGF
jgi:hypothetical protein